jgi:hypothetical protein
MLEVLIKYAELRTTSNNKLRQSFNYMSPGKIFLRKTQATMLGSFLYFTD